MSWAVRCYPTGEVEVPRPEVYWMEGFGDWTKLQFQVAILEGNGKRILINTGFPQDVADLTKAWQAAFGERALLHRPDSMRIENILAAHGVAPEAIDAVIITPIQLYATGNLSLFKNSRICFSRKGWIEDLIAPTYPHHVPRQGCMSDEHFFWLLGENQGNLVLLEDEAEPFPGIRSWWAGAHHRSSIAIEVTTARGKVVFSDCAFHYCNVEEGKPIGIAESIIEAHAAYARIRREADIFIPLYDPLVQENFRGGIIA